MKSDEMDPEEVRSHQNRQDAEIEAQQKEAPMIGNEEGTDCLKSFYKENIGFLRAIDWLCEKSFRMRRVRGDGNCFYRALLFGYLDQLLVKLSSSDDKEAAQRELDRLTSVMKGSMEDLVKVGYNEFAIETFFDMFVELLEQLPTMSRESLLAEFQEGGSGDHYTWYMRAMTAGYMKSHPDDYFPFIVAEGVYPDIFAFCEKEVEPMGKECEQMQITALTAYLKLSCKIIYVDGHLLEEQEPTTHVFQAASEDTSMSITLLYRPGHYDLLYGAE